MYHGVVKINECKCNLVQNHTKHQSSTTITKKVQPSKTHEMKLTRNLLRRAVNTPILLMERSNWTSSWACLLEDSGCAESIQASRYCMHVYYVLCMYYECTSKSLSNNMNFKCNKLQIQRFYLYIHVYTACSHM